ncbi:MAG: hypothetical protein QW118_02115 [Nitrososphaerota archaeon]
MPPHERFKLGLCYAFQIPRIFRGMTVLENTMVSLKRQLGEQFLIAPFRRKWINQEVKNAERVLSGARRIGYVNGMEWNKHFQRIKKPY